MCCEWHTLSLVVIYDLYVVGVALPDHPGSRCRKYEIDRSPGRPVHRESHRILRLLKGRDFADVDRAFGVPGIMGRLHPKPGLRTTSEQLGDPNGHLSRHGLLLCQNIVKLLPRNPEQAS